MSGPVIVMFVGVVIFGLTQVGSLPEIASLFRPVHASGGAAASASPFFPEWAPVLLVLCSATLLMSLAVGALLRRRHTASMLPTVQKAVILDKSEPPAAEAATTVSAASKSGPKPFLVSRSDDRHSAMEAFRLRRDERASAAARAAAAERVLSGVPSRPHPVFDSTPTLPMHPLVRRRDPRLGLPPALAAALQKQVAEGPRRRSASSPTAAIAPAVASL